MNVRPDGPPDLPLLDTGLAIKDVESGESQGFWPDIQELTDTEAFTAALDVGMAGRAAPRIWLLLHEPGRSRLAVVAALGLARALAARDQVACVLDGDDQTTNLSNWAGATETEGWIDLVRYGTSLLASSMPLPFPGRTARLLGVGSYAPTDATAAEVEELCERLRQQADDILVVLPVGAALRWGAQAPIRLLCLDDEARRGRGLTDALTDLTEAGYPATGVVGFASPLPKEPAAAAAEPPARVPAQKPAAPPQASEPPARPDPLAPVVDDGEPLPEETGGGARGTSGVFWLAAVAAAVLIAAVGYYYVRYVRPARDEAPPPAVASGPVAGDRYGAHVADSAAAALAAPAPVVTDSLAAMTADSVAVPPAVVLDEPGVTTEMTDPGIIPAVESAPADTPAEPAFVAGPYTGPVGEAGWAIHVYSFPDSASAATQIRTLARQGLVGTARTTEIEGKGLYYRVYVGSFPDRTAAQAAMPALLAKLKIDWAQARRFAATDD